MIIMINSQRFLLCTVVVNLGVASAAGQLAITEFMNNPDGADQGREWIELYNFGPVDLCLAGWTVEDQGTDLFALPDVTIPSGGYLVLVSGGVPGFGGVDAATAEAIFTEEWLDGLASPSVVGMEGMVLGNQADETVVRDPDGVVAWSIAWSDDETPPFATFLTHASGYVVRVFGDSGQPGVVRAGDDNGVPGFPGYQQNDVTRDPFAQFSQIDNLVALFGDDFANVLQPGLGSPLAGGYAVVPVGDIDGDGGIDLPDLLALLDAWGPCPEPCAACPADLNGDGVVGITDFLALLAGWTEALSDGSRLRLSTAISVVAALSSLDISANMPSTRRLATTESTALGRNLEPSDRT